MNLKLPLLALLLLLIPAAAKGEWIQSWVGYHATIELLADEASTTAMNATAETSTFPNGYALTSWFWVDERANELTFCHGINQFPPEGTAEAKLRAKKISTQFYSGDTEMEIGAKIVTKGWTGKSCGRTMIEPGETSVYALTTFNKIKGKIPVGSGLVPFGNVQQRAVAATTASRYLSEAEYREAARQVERYSRSLR